MLDLGERGGLTMEILRVKTERRRQVVDVTTAVDRAVKISGVASGICYVYVPHATAVMVGASQVIFVEGGKLVLGTWQGIFLCEFDGPRERKIFVRVEESKS